MAIQVQTNKNISTQPVALIKVALPTDNFNKTLHYKLGAKARREIISLICLLSLFASLLFGQKHPIHPVERPKIGLALSGGGAKGFAYIGLFKVLEELGIQPDYITGASMGSIMGGLYALGMKAEEIERLALMQDWDMIFSNTIPLQNIGIIEKEHYGTHFLELQYKNGKFSFPQGLIEGQHLAMVLAKMACSGHFIDNFDDFPIPFRCVAVNLLDGQVVTLDSGYLARAQRASMAIPSIFTPVEFGNQLLVDGGVIRNFPVQEAIDMGADFVIGAYAGNEDPDKKDLGSLVDILVQASFLQSVPDSKEQIKLCNLFIDMALNYEPSDFDKAADIIAEGEMIARSHIKELKALADQLKRYGDRPFKEGLKDPDFFHVHAVDIKAINPKLQPMVDRLINLKEGENYELMDIQNGINYAYGTQFFTKVNYSLSTDGDGTVIHVDANEVAPVTMKFGLHYSNVNDAAIILKGDLRNIGKTPIILSGGLRLSEFPAVTAQYKQYFGSNRRFVYQLGTNFQKYHQAVSLQNGDLIREYKHVNWEVGTSLMWIPRINYLIGLGYQFNASEYRPIKEAALDFSQFRSKGNVARIFFRFNNQDKLYFPQKGLAAQLSADVHHSFSYKEQFNNEEALQFLNIASPTNYFRGSLFLSNFNKLNQSIVLFQHLGIGLTSESGLLDNYLLGGDFFERQQSMPFVGLKEYEYPFSNVINIQLGIRWYLSSKLMLSTRVSLAQGGNKPQILLNKFNNHTHVGAGVSLEYDSFIGPLSLTFGRNSINDNFRLSVNLGYRFIYS